MVAPFRQSRQVREPCRALFGGARSCRRTPGELPASLHPSLSHQRGILPGSSPVRSGWPQLRVCFKTCSRVTKLSQHEADGGKFQEREGVAVEIFPILGETATTIEPCDGSFDDPTLG